MTVPGKAHPALSSLCVSTIGTVFASQSRGPRDEGAFPTSTLSVHSTALRALPQMYEGRGTHCTVTEALTRAWEEGAGGLDELGQSPGSLICQRPSLVLWGEVGGTLGLTCVLIVDSGSCDPFVT